MHTEDELKIFGVRVTPGVRDELSEWLYAEAGVTDVDEYYSSREGYVPRGDPSGELTALLIEDMVEDFDELYENADFENAVNAEPDEFVWVQIAGNPRKVFELKDLFDAAARIKKVDTRVVHTAIMKEVLQSELPELPENAVYVDGEK